MVYAIIAIVTVIALFLIFRDDHDTSYNRNEKRGHGPEKSQYDRKSAPRSEFKSEPKYSYDAHKEDVKDKVLNVVESIIKEVKEQPEPEEKDWEDDSEIDLSFLDTLDYSEDLEENTETFDITGLRYYCTVHDCGKIVGVVKPEPSNVHDSRAQAVIRSDGKLLGYIPKTQLDWYEDFNEEDVVCPFVGEIELDGRGWMQAEIKVIIPSSIEYVRDEIECEL